ncbi:unnamed protein product [Effrenium voratum]|uniref:Uncharacterized protein n=1 Tax=Effrenium voratum TaxID=2562239 RepID=A0AA36IL63_9DINO|nr:unnamed protein product [Effrenium voratum]
MRSSSSPALNRFSCYASGRPNSGREARLEPRAIWAEPGAPVQKECQRLRAEIRERQREDLRKLRHRPSLFCLLVASEDFKPLEHCEGVFFKEGRLARRVEQLEGTLLARTQRLDSLLNDLRELPSAARAETPMHGQSAVANDASRFQDGTEVQAWRLQEIHLVRDVQVHGAQSHREEFAALREGEQAQRAVKRRGRPPEPFEACSLSLLKVAAFPSTPSMPFLSAAEGLAGAQLLEELQALQARCQQLEENSQMAARGAEEARRAAALSAERAEVAERRAWATAEAANELALMADLRHVEVLEIQLKLREELSAATTRCEVLESVAQNLASEAIQIRK